MNSQLLLLQRVVLHPTYRGAGIAATFVRRSCELSRFPWIETLTQMGHINPFFERAGFVRVGATKRHTASLASHSALYGGRRKGKSGRVSKETHEKSKHTTPVYYIFDNRDQARSSKSLRDL